MRLLLSLLALGGLLSACRLEPPGASALHAAQQIFYGPDNARYSGDTLWPDSLALMYAHFDRAIQAGHPRASVSKANAVWMSEGLLTSEPIWPHVAEDDQLAWSERDVAYGFLALIARDRPRLGRGLRSQDLPSGSALRYTDAVAEPAVLREGSRAGSAHADPDRLRLLALDLLNGQPSARHPHPFLSGVAWGAPGAPPAQRDSAVALLSGLAEAGDADAAYLLALAATDRDERDRHLDEAIRLGSAAACPRRAFWMSGPSARETAAHLDALEACEAVPGWNPPPDVSAPCGATDRALRREIADGNAAARAMRDSLVALGPFSDA